MASQLGWVQINKALGARRAGARGSDWGGDERPVRAPHRGRRVGRDLAHRVFRPGRALVLIALVAVTIVSLVV